MAGPALTSVTSALRILTLLAESGEMGVTDLARESGLPKSMVHRLLTTMKQERFVAQVKSRRYRVGPMACAVGQSFTSHDNIFSAAVAVIEDRLRTHTSYVGYLDGYETITVAVREGSGTVTVKAAGSRTMVHTTAVGKVLTAALPDEEIHHMYSRWHFPSVTPYTIRDWNSWLREIERVRRLGYATTRHELEVGVGSIGAPVQGPSGTVAGLSIAYAVGTISDRHHDRLVGLVRDSAVRMSERLGGLSAIAIPINHSRGVSK